MSWYFTIFVIIVLWTLSFISYRFFIRFLGSKIKQYVREDAPKHHKVKEGTPTAGGIIFSIFILIFSIILFFIQPLPIYVGFIIIFLGCFLIGFYDDLMKIINKRNLGLKAREKLFWQLVITALFFFSMIYNNDYFNSMNLNFSSLVFNKNVLDLGYFYFLFLFFLISGVSNATNLTDGLDGLLASLSIFTFLAYIVVFSLMGLYNVVIFIVAIIGFLVVFLFFNFPKASVFMGDSGSMAIGSLFVYFSIISKTEVYLFFFGYIYFLVTLSVILQVLYFKITKGRRLFTITPLHHHFELLGYDEKNILLRFNLLNFVFILVGLFFFVFKFM